MEKQRTDINHTSEIRELTKIEMSLNSFPNRVGIFVESPNNEKLFKPLFDKTCRFFVRHGWKKVLEGIEFFNKSTNIFAVIGIIDADFRRITGNFLTEKNIFMTDFHDTEMMTIFSESWDHIIYREADTEKLADFEQKKHFKDFLLELIKPLSCLRLLNETENLGLIFKKANKENQEFKYIEYKLFVNEKLEFDFKNLLKAVENRSEKPNYFKNNPQIMQKLTDLQTKIFDLKEISNGHDFMNVLAIALQKAISNKKIDAEHLENLFIIAYRFTDFQKTELYQTLENWQRRTKNFIIFKENLQK